MAGEVELVVDGKQVNDLLKVLGNVKDAQTVYKRAIGDTTARGKKQVTDEIARKLNLKKTAIRKRIKTSRESPLSGRVSISGDGIPLGYYGLTDTPLSAIAASIHTAPKRKPQVTVTVRTGKVETPKGAFWSVFKSGHVAIVERVGRKELPLREKVGPSIGGALEGTGLSNTVTTGLGDYLQKRIDAHLQLVIDKR